MIDLFVKAWDENNKLLLKEFETTIPDGYQDIVKKLISIVINPYLYKIKPKYPESDGLDIDSMTIIDDGDYQGTQIFIIPFNTYQPDTNDYVFTHNYYGSCSGCDTYQNILMCCDYDENCNKIPTKEIAKDLHTLALHLLQAFRYLDKENKTMLSVEQINNLEAENTQLKKVLKDIRATIDFECECKKGEMCICNVCDKYDAIINKIDGVLKSNE